MSPDSADSRRGDFIYSAVFAGALGSAAVALLFLAVDGIRGDPFFTPSLLGSVLFLRQDAPAVTVVRLDMLALYSVVHLAVFTLVGAAATFVHARPKPGGRSAIALGVALMVVLCAGILATNAVFMPGVVQRIGLVPVLIANALASVVMARFIHGAVQHGP